VSVARRCAFAIEDVEIRSKQMARRNLILNLLMLGVFSSKNSILINCETPALSCDAPPALAVVEAFT
jgi:hypothetical protein